MTVVANAIHRSITVASLLVLTGLTRLLGQHSIPEPSAVLQALRENDEALLQRYSLTMRVDQTLRFPDWTRDTYRLRATCDPSQAITAIVLDQKEFLKYPSYSALRAEHERWGNLPNPPGMDPSLAPFGSWWKMVYLQEGRRYLDAMWAYGAWLSSEGDIVSQRFATKPTIEILRSASSLALGKLESGIQALGRGFSRELGQALSVSALPSGLLELKASDRESPTVIWRLVIDPSRQYLVVEAEEIWEGRVFFRYKSEGMIDSATPLAKRGVQINYLDNGDEWVFRFECESYEARFREDWYNEVKQVFRCPPKGTSVLDHRTEPFSSFTVK